MATNIEQIFRSFVVNKFKEIQEEGKLTSENSENSPNGEVTAQKEENAAESMAVCVQSEEPAPAGQDETINTENLELAKPVTKDVETDSASKEFKSAELTSDDDVKRESPKSKKSKKHKKHKSKKKKKKKKKEKHEKRSKSVSSVEDQENVSSETKSVWKPAFSSPPKEQGVLDALSSKPENTNTDVLTSVNTQESSAMGDKPEGLLLDADSGFFGPKCPVELSKNVSSNSLLCDAEIQEQCEASVLPAQLSNESTAHTEKTSEIAETQQSGLSLPIFSQEKSTAVNSSLDVNSEKDSLNHSNRGESLSRSQSKSNCEKLQNSKEKSRSNSRHRSRSRSSKKTPKNIESAKSPKPRSYSISRDQRKKSRSSSAGQRRRSTSRSPARRRRSRSRTSRFSKSPIRNWWSKSIRNRRRSVSVVKRHGSRTRSPARRNKSRSRSAEKRRSRTRSKSVKRRRSKSTSLSRFRRSRSYSGSRRRKSKSGSIGRRQRSWSRFAARKRWSRSTSATRKRRSRSASAVRRLKSRSISPARRRRSRSATPAKRRSRSVSPVRRRRSRSASFARRRRRSRSASPARRRRSRSISPVRRRRSRSISPARRRRSRSASPARRRRSRSNSPVRRRRSRSSSPARRRRSASPARRRRSRSASPARRRRSSSVSRTRKSAERRQRSNSAVKRPRSRSGSDARKQSARSTSAARKASRSTSPSTSRKPSQLITGNMSQPEKSGSIERKQKSRSRSSSKVRILELAPLNKNQLSISPTINQTKPASSLETINNESELSEMTSESLKTLYLEKTDKLVNLIESSSENVQEIDSCSLPSVTEEKMVDSSFKAPASNLPCTPFESDSQQNHSSCKSDTEMLTATYISVELPKPVDQTSLECIETKYEEQISSGGAENLNDLVFQSSENINTVLAEERCDAIHKPDLVSAENEQTSATKPKDSSDVLGPTTGNQNSMDNEVVNQALNSDCTSSEAEGNLSYLNLDSNQNSCAMALSPPPEETMQCSDWKYFESSSHQMSNDDGFKKPDGVISPSSLIEASPGHSSALTLQETSASHSKKSNTELNLVHSPMYHAPVTSQVTTDGAKPNLFLATNNTSLESTLNNQSEIPITTLKEPVSECSSQVDANSNFHLKHEDDSTPSGIDKVLFNSTEESHATLVVEQSYSIRSEQTCSMQTNKDIAFGKTAESFAVENLTSTSEAESAERKTEIVDLKRHPEVELTETCISKPCKETGVSSPKHMIQSHDMFSNSQDQTNVHFQESEPQVCRPFTNDTSTPREVLEPVQHGGLYQSLYISSENIECVSATSELYARSSVDDSGKEHYGKSQNLNENTESMEMEKSCTQDSEMHFKDHSKVQSMPASGDAEARTISAGPQEVECVADEERCNLVSEAEQESASPVPGSQIFPETSKVLGPEAVPSQKQQIFIQITDKLSKTTVEQTDGEIRSLGNSSDEKLENIAKSSTTKTNDGKDLGSTMYLSIDSKDGNRLLAEKQDGNGHLAEKQDGNRLLTEKQFESEIEAGNYSQEKTTTPCTALNVDSLSFKQNAGSEMDVKLVTEEESNTEPLAKLDKNVNLEADVESKMKNHGQTENASNTETVHVGCNTPEAPKSTTCTSQIQKPLTAMPLQFKFSKTFKTLATSQLCNTSDESSDKEVSKVSTLSLSAKASVSSRVESARTKAKSPQKDLQLKQLDTPSLPETLQPEILSNVESDGKDVLQQDVIQTDDSQSSAAIKLTFPHISNALSKLGVKQRQYRSRSVARDSRSPSMDRRRASRSRSKSTARKRSSRSKSVSRKKRSQSSSRKKSSHSKSSKSKRSRSKSRGRKRRSQSKSKSKKKHSPSGKRKRSRSKSSERVRSVGKRERSRSKSKTRRKEVQTKSPNRSRRSRSKSTVRKRSRSKNFDARKASRSKSGSSRSRSRSLSGSRRHLLHSRVSSHRKISRSSSKSTSPRKRSLSRNRGRSPSRSPTRRHRSRSRSRTRRHRSRSRGRWRRSLSSSRKRSRSSSRTSGTLSTRKRRSVSKSPIRGHRSRSQTKLKDKSPLTKRKSISPLPQKKTIQAKAAAFKHSIGLKSLIQKQLSQAKSQGSSGKLLSKEHIPLSSLAARAQLPAATFSSRAQVSGSSLSTMSHMSVPNLAEVPLPSENGNGQIPVPSLLPEQQMSLTSLAPEVSLPVPDLTTATPWHVPEMASGAQWSVPDIAAGTQWSMSDLTASAQWPMADLAAGSHWPIHDLGVGTQWSVPDLAAGTPWAMPDVATGAQWTVPDLTASTQWTVPDLTAGSQWAMSNLAPGTQWSVPDLAAAAHWTVPDLTSGTHIQSADLAPEAQVLGSDLGNEAQVPGSDLATEAQVPGSDLAAEAQVPRSDLVSEAQVPVPDHIPDTCDDLVSEGHNLMPDVTAEALVPVASGTLVPDVAAGIPLPDVTAASPSPVPDVAATANLPVPDVATTAHSFISDYASFSTVHESVFENTVKQSAYLDMPLSTGELVDRSSVAKSLVSTKKLHSEAPNRTEHVTTLESISSTVPCLPSELPSTHATVPEMSASLSQEISVSSEFQLKREPCSTSNPPSFDSYLRSETSSLIETTPDQGSSGMSIQFESHTNSDCQLLPAPDTDSTSVNNFHAGSNPILLHESCPSPMQSYISPNHTTMVDPYHSPENSLLVEPYSSPDRPILGTEYSGSVCQLLTEPDAVSDCSALAASCVSSEHSPIVQDYSSHGHSHEELTEHPVGLDTLQKQEPSTILPSSEPPDCFAKPHYPEQANTNVSPSCRIPGDRSVDPDIPQLVEPYGSPEHPQLVEPYASPEQPQLVEPYASPECPQLVEPYASPEHPLLVEPYGSPDSQELNESDVGQEFPQSSASLESPQAVQSCTNSQQQTQMVQQNSISKSLNSPESPHVIQSSANLQSPNLDLPYASLEHKLDEASSSQKPIDLKPFINSESLHVVQSCSVPECLQVVQSPASTVCPQLVQLYDIPEHPQLVQPYDSPEHPQLVQQYESPAHSQPVKPYESPEHPPQDLPLNSPDPPLPVLPFASMEGSRLVQANIVPECSQLVQPCISPKHSQLDQSHAEPERLHQDKPYANSKHLQTEQPHKSPKNEHLDQPYTSPEKSQLVQHFESEEHPQLVQPYDSPEHLQLVQPCASTDQPQPVETYASSEQLQVIEKNSQLHSQLVESYSSTYHNQCDKPNIAPDLPLTLESSCHDAIDEKCKLTQSPLSDSKFGESCDANATEPLLPCLSLLQKDSSPKLSQSILEKCSESSYKICSEDLHDATHKSLLGKSESPSRLVSKEDYIDSDKNLSGDCYSSDSTQLDRSAATSHKLELDHSSNFHQLQIEKPLAGKKPLQLETPDAKDDQHIEKKLDPVQVCAIPDQAQISSENTNSEDYLSSSVSCLNKDHFCTDQVLSDDLVNASSQPLHQGNSSINDQLLKDPCLDFPHITSPQANTDKPSDILERPSMPFLDGATSNSDVSMTDRTTSRLDTLYGDSVVPCLEQEEQSGELKEDENLSTTEQHLMDGSTEILEYGLPYRLTAQTTSDIVPQNESIENYNYSHSENKYQRPGQPFQEHPFISAKERTPLDASENTGLDADCSRNGQIVSNPDIDVSKLDKTTVDHHLSPEPICNKTLATVLSAETKEPSTNFSLQTQKVDSPMSVQVSTLSVEFETHVAGDSGDDVQIDHECKITPPDLLPFDSEQPTHMCLNSESSSEPVLFNSQPPPELLPYDSEQPANPFQNTSDYSSEQESSVFHTPPELLPYDSDQTTMLVSEPESSKENLSFCEPTDPLHESSAFSASKNLVSPPSVVEQATKMPSVEETDTTIISTKELVCVECATPSSSILMQASDLNKAEILVEQSAAPFLDAESSQSSCDETKGMLEQQFLSKITTLHPISPKEPSVDSQDIIEDSVKSAPLVSTENIEQAPLLLNTCDKSVVPYCSDNSEVGDFSELEKQTLPQTHVSMEASNKRSRSKSLVKAEVSHSLSTSTKHDSPLRRAGRAARSHSRSKGRKKSRSKSTTRKKRSLSKSGARTKKSRSKSVVKTRKSRSKSVTRRKKSRSVSDIRLRRSRSRSLSRKRRSRSTSVAHKRSSRSPSLVRRRRSRSSRRKRSYSKSVDHKRSHSHSVARRRRSRSLSITRRRHSRSRSPVRRRRSRSSSLHRRKRSRSSSLARRRRSRSSSLTRRRRSRSSSLSRRRHSPSQAVTRRRRSPSLGRRRRSRSTSLPRRRRSRSASHRRRSRSPSASRRRRSPSAPRRKRSPSPPRRKRSTSRKRRSRSTSVTRKRHSRSSSVSRKKRSRSSSISRKRHSQTPLACKRKSESKSPSPKSPKNKPQAQSKPERSRSRSQSNVVRKRKTHSRSSSRDNNKSNEKRRKRSNSKEHYNSKQRRKSRSPPRRKKSRSPVRRVSPSPVRRRRSRSPVRRKSFSRSPVRRKRSRSRDQSMDSARSPKRLTDLDKAQLLEIAKANAAAMCAKAGMPLPANLKPVLTPSAPADEKITQRTYGVTIQELTEKCKQIAQSKEDDEVVNRPHDSDEEEGDKPFYNHPFKVSEHKPISFSLLNPSLKPAPKNQVTLTKEFPVSSGSQHRKKESDKVYGEWVPVDKKSEESKDDVFTNTGPSQPVDITAAMNERAMAQTRLTGNPFDLEALLMLNRAQEQIDAWAQSTSLPGQFTGSTGAQVLTADEISNSGPQAWLKKQVLKRDRTLV